MPDAVFAFRTARGPCAARPERAEWADWGVRERRHHSYERCSVWGWVGRTAAGTWVGQGDRSITRCSAHHDTGIEEQRNCLRGSGRTSITTGVGVFWTQRVVRVRG